MVKTIGYMRPKQQIKSLKTKQLITQQDQSKQLFRNFDSQKICLETFSLPTAEQIPQILFWL